jgi:hypothetical protein
VEARAGSAKATVVVVAASAAHAMVPAPRRLCAAPLLDVVCSSACGRGDGERLVGSGSCRVDVSRGVFSKGGEISARDGSGRAGGEGWDERAPCRRP